MDKAKKQLNPKVERRYILIQFCGVILTLLGTFISIYNEMQENDPVLGAAVFSVGIMLFIYGKFLMRNRKK